jgi:hypothetical protein
MIFLCSDHVLSLLTEDGFMIFSREQLTGFGLSADGKYNSN